MSTERNGIALVEVVDSQLLKMTVAASIAGGIISTVRNDANTSREPDATTDKALHIFSEVYERIFGERWEPPTRRG